MTDIPRYLTKNDSNAFVGVCVYCKLNFPATSLRCDWTVRMLRACIECRKGETDYNVTMRARRHDKEMDNNFEIPTTPIITPPEFGPQGKKETELTEQEYHNKIWNLQKEINPEPEKLITTKGSVLDNPKIVTVFKDTKLEPDFSNTLKPVKIPTSGVSDATIMIMLLELENAHLKSIVKKDSSFDVVIEKYKGQYK